ncbi:MAG: response regulator transcription factor [Caldilinea sp.]|uniref:response regulator transcription factor n=1 Tax=Caldilinea sp. TaxID=2293560 RepID=UPI003095F0CB
MSAIRVFLADDHAVLRDSLKVFLSLHSDLVLVGEAGDGLETVRETLRAKPDVLVLDLALPTLSGLEVTQRIRRDLPACKIVVLTQYQDPEQALPVLRAGANGYVLKKSGGHEVVDAIRAVARGEAYLHPAIAQMVLEHSLRGEEYWFDPIAVLTPREHEVLALIGAGMTNQEIAAALNISRKTVDKYRAALLEKLGLSSRAELIRFAVEHRIHPDRP